MSAIKLDHVYTTYEGEKIPAIRDINLDVRYNEFVYVIGPNGSGKTTLLETINGLLSPIRGRISVMDLDLKKHGTKVRCEIGYLPQDFMVGPREPYTALDVVLMGRFGKIGALYKPSCRDMELATESMRLLGVDNLAHRPMGKLSGGQQQKVMISRVLAKEPRILLLDEPFSNLDFESRWRIRDLMQSIHRERKMTTVIVTHDASLLPQHPNRIIAMADGKIVADKRKTKVWGSLRRRLSFDMA